MSVSHLVELVHDLNNQTVRSTETDCDRQTDKRGRHTDMDRQSETYVGGVEVDIQTCGITGGCTP